MDEDLISKKELLMLTGVSYGALYRWKRKALIPEEWFIKKTVFTGQETFFPKAKILERIAKIQEMKEELSLDDLAQTFSGAPPAQRFSPNEMAESRLISDAVLRLRDVKPDEKIDFYGGLYLYICNKLLVDGMCGLSEAESILTLLLKDFKQFATPPRLIVNRKLGVTFAMLIPEKVQVANDDEVRNIVALSLERIWEELKTKWGTK